MRPILISVLLFLAAICCGVAFARHCPGCIDRTRVNKACEWTGDTAFAIDWDDAAHREHLARDAQLAEDLAIRRADAEFDRLYGYEAHGGLIENRRVVNDCMGWLVTLIEANHDVTPALIALARGQRSWLFDTTVVVSFLPMYVWGALVACRRLHRRMANEPRHVRIVAFALTAIAATVLALQAGQLWGAVWEAIRVRNGHMSSFRGASDTRWLAHHIEAVFAIAFLLFVLVARFSQHATRFDLVRRAVLFAATMLAAMFADVFLRHAIGYMILANALAAFLYVVWRALPPPQSVIDQPFHPRLGLWHNRPL